VVISGETVSECAVEAKRLADEEGYTFVHPYDDRAVIAGQGTCGLELGLDHPDLDVVVVPVGGGGLAAGVATAITSLLPGVEVIGVQTEAYPAMARVLAGEAIPPFPNETLADGIAVKRPGDLTTPVLAEQLTDMLLVDEEHVEHAVSLLAEIEKTVAEGAGAAALAGILQHPERFAGRSVGVIVSGGNIDSRVLASVLMRELVRSGRLLTLGITIKDRPGQLAPVIDRIAETGANIVEVRHSRLFDPASVRQTFIEVEIETRDRPHAEKVVGALRDDGLEVKVMSR
jgi:threonine dehydratase